MLNSTQSRHLELWHLVTQPGLREGFLNNLNPLKFLIQIIQLNGLNQNIHKQIITQIRFLEISVIKFQIFSILGILSFIFKYLRQLQMKIRSYSILLTLALLVLLSFSQELQTAPSQLKKQILPKKEQQQSKQIIVNSKNEQEINQKGNKIQQQQQKADLDIPFYCGPKINQGIRGLSAKPVPGKLAAKGRQRLTPTVYGIDLFVDSVDITVSRLIMTKGFWQPGYINLIGHIVKPGFKVLNLGSQSGLQSMIMGKIIGQTGKLYIFQPYSFSNNLVTKNVELNGLKNITTIYKYGASDQKSTATIEVTYGNTGGSRIFPSEKSQPLLSLRNGHIINHKQDVLIDTVDAILPENATLDFALIDVEKMQMKALRGMKEIIKRSPKLIIMSEWQYMYNPDSDEEKTRQFFNFMFERGYKIYMYKDKGAYEDYIAECKIGEFQPVQNIETLFKISNSDIFLFPKDSELPK